MYPARYLPLAPRLALWTPIEPDNLPKIGSGALPARRSIGREATPKFVRDMNRLVLQCAENIVLSSEPRPYISACVEKYKNWRVHSGEVMRIPTADGHYEVIQTRASPHRTQVRLLCLVLASRGGSTANPAVHPGIFPSAGECARTWDRAFRAHSGAMLGASKHSALLRDRVPFRTQPSSIAQPLPLSGPPDLPAASAPHCSTSGRRILAGLAPAMPLQCLAHSGRCGWCFQWACAVFLQGPHRWLRVTCPSPRHRRADRSLHRAACIRPRTRMPERSHRWLPTA